MDWNQFKPHHQENAKLDIQVWLGQNEISTLCAKKLRSIPFFRQCDVTYSNFKDDVEDAFIKGIIEREWASVQNFEAEGKIADILLEPWTKSQSTSAIATNAPLDNGSTFGIFPGGNFVYNLERESFQRLGLPADAIRPNQQSSLLRPGGEKSTRYFGFVNLLSPSLKPGKPLYNKFIDCLKRGPQERCKVLFSAELDAIVMNSVSVSTRIKTVKPEFYVIQKIRCPIFKINENTEAQDVSKLQGTMFDWLSAASCGLESILKNPSLIDPMDNLSFHSQFSILHRFRLSGIIPTTTVRGTIEKAHEISKLTQNWVAITCWGFEDSPGYIGKLGEPTFNSGGDNIITFIVQASDGIENAKQFVSIIHGKCLYPE